MAKTINLSGLVALANVLLWLMAMTACVAAGLAEGGFGEVAAFWAKKLAAAYVATLMLAAVQLLVVIVIESFVGTISIGLLPR